MTSWCAVEVVGGHLWSIHAHSQNYPKRIRIWSHTGCSMCTQGWKNCVLFYLIIKKLYNSTFFLTKQKQQQQQKYNRQTHSLFSIYKGTKETPDALLVLVHNTNLWHTSPCNFN